MPYEFLKAAARTGRIEGYRTRTVERSVLQLQALVDQVIADTASDTPTPAVSGETADPSTQQPTTFLPRPEASESAPAAERLQYIWLLNFSTRWNLESELAQRWVGLGALRTALDIYERLQMWAEAALCYAATDREETAKLMVRKQLYQRTNPDSTGDDDTWQGAELSTLPPDAPRLFCILGDIDRDAAMYERAWTVSNKRYARAQRSLARLYMQEKPPNLVKAEEAYKLSLAVTRLNHASWFAIGCIQLELEKWEDAIDSFTRTVQLEETDAEAWNSDHPAGGSSISISYDPAAIRPGSIHAKLLRLFDENIIPLITHSPELWLLVADLEKWRGRPSQALAAHEKAWRATTASCAQGAYQMGEEDKWNDIVKATETLVRKGYAVYGGMDKETEDGSKADEPELVAKDWRFKSRSAVRGILGKGKAFWDGTEGWSRLDTLLKEVSGN
ncbi:TPR domain-containing protein [Trichophyton equinum CBS 127.97]|uniref:TPR domain-containing protein n=1 Tax=Trichophyton equinum (strain ATCC MYA-4606 / CBS 127.97) TaxID=559882 RepID=F2Q0S8_TRIEC|nr:TPR domain-containing protein [Trichophyton equinum CBS 127.97]